ncbi:transcriptional regulator with XRE-family HTH domain [Flavobacterium sp. CG_9.10]|uniref:helix-turn-helix domain-containing protein n=1 Tax=Flavobacterium sp. CG_9.10 TaxID=2787729 RepID=UPI0018C95126|nr:helix-turn-helix transcriptional regulator [Flavobacterium sp. CG_9.10]MBG6110974.1 transcriptional regulator with XRE-family HTH domain [Flavobacterium sp. CG_9.10]
MDKPDRNIILINFGKKLRLTRLAKGFTQEQLANELGVEISQISRIERGVINTSITTLYGISKVLNVSISELFAFDGNE